MDRSPTDEWQEARAPIASLIGKSEKALRKLTPGTWQHTMLRENLRALRMAWALMSGGGGGAGHFTREDLQEALRAFASMIGRVEKAGAKFLPGSSQHTLQRNRLQALRMAEAVTKRALDQRGA